MCAPSVQAARSDSETQEILNRELRQAAILGLIPRILDLIHHGAQVNTRAPYGETALDYAVRFHRHQAAIQLLETGADPNISDDTGATPLFRAVTDCNASEVVEKLLRSGADVNHRDLYHRTPLMGAARSACVRNVAVILDRARDTVQLDAIDDQLMRASDLAPNGLIPGMLDAAAEKRRGGVERPAAVKSVRLK